MTMKDWPHANLFYLIRPFALNLCCIFQLKDYIKRISSNGDAFFSLSYHFLSRREESIDIRILIVSTYKIHINHWGFGSSGLFRVLAHHNSPCQAHHGFPGTTGHFFPPKFRVVAPRAMAIWLHPRHWNGRLRWSWQKGNRWNRSSLWKIDVHMCAGIYWWCF